MLIQRFGSAANVSVHLLCLVLDGVYRRCAAGTPEFVEGPAPTDKALQAVLHMIITRLLKLGTCRGVLVEEEGSTCVADNEVLGRGVHAHAAAGCRACSP